MAWTANMNILDAADDDQIFHAMRGDYTSWVTSNGVRLNEWIQALVPSNRLHVGLSQQRRSTCHYRQIILDELDVKNEKEGFLYQQGSSGIMLRDTVLNSLTYWDNSISTPLSLGRRQRVDPIVWILTSTSTDESRRTTCWDCSSSWTMS